MSPVPNSSTSRARRSTWTTIGSPDTSSPYSASWNTAALGDGSYDLRVVTTDNAGLTFTSAVRTVQVDTTAPSVAITFPVDDGFYDDTNWNAGCVAGSGDICGTASDAGGVASVGVTIQRSSDSRYWTGNAGTTTTQWSTTVQNLTVTGTTAWNRALTTASLQTNVTYTVKATATDGVGLTGTATNVFVYDTSDPTGTITVPVNGANVSGSVPVTSNSSDGAGSGVASAVFQYRVLTTGAWTTIGTALTSPYTVSWNTTGVADNQYYLRVTTTDRLGNVVSSSDTATRVRVDNADPTGELTAPSNGATVGSPVTVSSSSADAGSGVLNATFQYSPANAGTWNTIGAPDTSSPYSVSWTTSALPDGLLRPAGHHDRQRRQHLHVADPYGHGRHHAAVGRHHLPGRRCGLQRRRLERGRVRSASAAPPPTLRRAPSPASP